MNFPFVSDWIEDAFGCDGCEPFAVLSAFVF